MARTPKAEFTISAEDLAERTGFPRKSISTYTRGRGYSRLKPDGDVYETTYQPLLRKGKHFDYVPDPDDAMGAPVLRYAESAVELLSERRRKLDEARTPGERYPSGRKRRSSAA